MNPHDIKASLGKKGFSMARIARSLNLSGQAVSHVVYGIYRSRRIETAIIEATGISGKCLWPKWYSEQASSNTHAA